ncbi:MAG: glycoside hydrolase family 97 protein [Kiritimatiellia bacterium]
MKRGFLAGGMALALAALGATETLVSPDGTISVSVGADGDLSWSVARKGVELVKPSRLGLDFLFQSPWRNFRVLSARRRSHDDAWTTRLYKKERIRDRANELELALEDGEGRLLTLVFRAYDEGVAFRYVVPEQKAFDGFQLRGEFTQWRFPEGADGWFTSYSNWVSSQENHFRRRKISEIGAKELVGMPAIVNVGGQRVALCEADLTNWAGIYYRVPAKGQPPDASVLEAALTPLPPSNACAKDVAVIRMTPAASPWRVMICADSDVDLLNRNDIVLNLNPPADPALDFSWVVPGASSWDWWTESNNSLSTELTLKLVDFAAEMGWKYHTIDGGWYGWARRPNHGPDVPITIRKGFDLHRIVAHAKEKGVGIWVWLHWEALHDNGVEETFAKLEAWGVKGVKIDFLDRQDQWMVRWYESTVRAAARHHLMINYHGAFKPTGMNRTWPNQITREGIRGNEMTKFASDITPEHAATLPFTRFLLGPGDFTPGGFANVHSEAFVPQCKRGHRYGDETDRRPIWAEVIGTRAHEMALCIAYDSPLMTMCDWPERYRGAKGVEALKALPTAWKNTLPLAGEIGRHYGVVRETHDGRFYLAVLGVKEATFEFPLSFLPEGTEWNATFYVDGPNAAADATDLSVSEQVLTRTSTIKLAVAREGGAVVVFAPRPAGK